MEVAGPGQRPGRPHVLPCRWLPRKPGAEWVRNFINDGDIIRAATTLLLGDGARRAMSLWQLARALYRWLEPPGPAVVPLLVDTDADEPRTPGFSLYELQADRHARRFLSRWAQVDLQAPQPARRNPRDALVLLRVQLAVELDPVPDDGAPRRSVGRGLPVATADRLRRELTEQFRDFVITGSLDDDDALMLAACIARMASSWLRRGGAR